MHQPTLRQITFNSGHTIGDEPIAKGENPNNGSVIAISYHPKQEAIEEDFTLTEIESKGDDPIEHKMTDNPLTISQKLSWEDSWQGGIDDNGEEED